MSDDVPTKRSRWLVLCLTLIPLWLVISAGAAVWWSLHSHDKEDEERNQRFAMEMSVERIADDMRKLVEVIGPRDADHPEALMRAAAMIDGTLGPANTGYQIQRIPGPTEAPIIRATLAGKNKDALPYWVISSYDSSADPEFLTRYSSSVAATIAAAQAMARDEPGCDIHFFFLPAGYDDGSTCLKLVNTLQATMPRPSLVFYVGNMLNGSHLTTNGSILTDTAEIKALGELGSYTFKGEMIRPAAEIHFQLKLPTLHVMSIAAHNAEDTDPANAIAVSAGKLVEWLRRCANLAAAR